MKTQCKCGAILNAKEELAGKQAKCPKCGDTILIPKPSSMRLTCSCGQVVQAKASLAGKRVKCPTCNQPIDIPNVNGALGSGVRNAAKMNNAPSIGEPFPQLPATPATGFNNSVWDDLAKAAEKPESASKAEPYQHTSKTVAKRSGANKAEQFVELGPTRNHVRLCWCVADRCCDRCHSVSMAIQGSAIDYWWTDLDYRFVAVEYHRPHLVSNGSKTGRSQSLDLLGGCL